VVQSASLGAGKSGDLRAQWAKSVGSDPIFAAIAEHKTAVETVPNDEPERRAALGRAEDMMASLFTTPITTQPAWLQHVAEPEHSDGGEIPVLIVGEYLSEDFYDAVVQQFLNAAAVLKGAQVAA